MYSYDIYGYSAYHLTVPKSITACTNHICSEVN